MSWLTDLNAEDMSDHRWDMVTGLATKVHDHLRDSDHPNWQDTYDKAFDAIMERVKEDTLFSLANIKTGYLYLLNHAELTKDTKHTNREFQVSRNRWKNLKSPEKANLRQELLEFVRDDDYTLTPVEGFIIVARYTFGLTFKAIGDMLDMDSQFVSSALDSIAEKLILEMGERVEVHAQPEPEPIVVKPQKFDSRFIPGASRRVR